MSYTPGPERLEPVVLEGQFVRLEPLTRAALPDLARVAYDPRIWEFMTARVTAAADLEAWLESALQQQASGLALPFAVVDRASTYAIGSTRLFDYRPADRGVEIGHTWYARPSWATRINPESKLLLLAHAFETLGLVRVQLKTDALNVRSRNAIARLGAREEGTLRKHTLVPGPRYRDTVYFSVLDDEWPAVKRNLLARLQSEK
jgi:RimJ/RimL family protein N-acetyltransferase